ncbi:uncharacterized protein ARMOST_20751 [Armillaria ostoyae]|uniref:Uncharacterized protein n=1 Tax=Armillaria ostoyae TaxID=47428 RepID=A0A284S862_ARMOS|nr:uncharacterized protein ARMOST_20751 [Armillaria ostoyae]
MPRISNPAPKKKPGPKSWATEEQWDFLVANCPDFRVAQAARGKKTALDDFWKKILRIFLEQFPIEEENDELLNFWRTRLKQWYNNHSNKDHLSPTAVKAVLPKSDTRRLKPVELYSHLYYPMRLKSAVAAKIEEDAIPKPQVLNCIRGGYEVVERSVEERESKPKEVMTPEDYAAAYKDAEVHITKFIQALGEATGGCITVLFGACDPNAGGKVRTCGYHLGKDSEGNNFGVSNPNYMDKILKLFTSIVKKAIPPEVREARALKKRIEEDEEDNEADALPPTTKSPVAGPQCEPPLPPVPPSPTAPLPKSPVAGPQPELPLPPAPPSPPGPQPELAKSPAPGPQPQPVDVNTGQADIEDPDQNGINRERCEDGSARIHTDDTATPNDDSVAAPAKTKVARCKRPISEVETVASTREKRSRFALAAWEALTMAELAARRNGKGDETFNEAVKGKPKVSKKTKR